MSQQPFRIDVHAHMIPDFYLDALASAGIVTSGSIAYPEWTPETALGLMDRHGIATAITSISSPGVHFGNPAAAVDLARRCNDYSAALIKTHPGRFGSFAVLPLPDVDAAAREADRALGELGLDGVVLLASYGEAFLGAPAFDPLMEVLDRHGAVVFVHPNVHPSTAHVQLGFPAFLLEFAFDTTRAAVSMLSAGTLDRFPDIEFILAHAGGTLPYLAWRLSQGATIDPRLQSLPSDMFGAVRRFWFDTALSAGPQSLATLTAVAAPDRILFGSDWPFAPEPVAAASIAALDGPGGPAPQLNRAIARDNAARLFARFDTQKAMRAT